MRVIITRPIEDALPLKARLELLGHSVTILPLLEIVPRTDVLVPARAWQAICVTSANALRQVVLPPELKRLPLLTLGPQSAGEARRAGFASVEEQGGDVHGLVHHIAAHHSPKNGPLLYLSGAETSGDLEGQLAARGFDVTRIITYDAMPTNPQFNPDDADAVLLYSPRSAVLWCALLDRLAIPPAQLLHLCLSANVAAKLPSTFMRKISASPREDDMLALLERNRKTE
jgi:uroporphyrinogen-III synthase